MKRRYLMACLLTVVASACGSPDQLAASCSAGYLDVCVYVDDAVTCRQITSNNFRVVDDVYGLDPNGNGLACDAEDLAYPDSPNAGANRS